MKNLQELPRLRDSTSYLYVEHAIINRSQKAIEVVSIDGKIPVPAASLAVMLLGPGTTITHAAVAALVDNGCSIVWVGAEGTKFYAQGVGETRKAGHLIQQAMLVSNPDTRKAVVLRMYRKRFSTDLDPALSLPQIRGLEGVRVREAYQKASEKFGVAWAGRRYDRGNWSGADMINRAISAANALLNGLCHAAIVSGGYSTALGFIHTGKQLSFVYDIADLYKMDITIPLAFQVVSENSHSVEKMVRTACREKFRELKLLQRILPDIDEVLSISPGGVEQSDDLDKDPALPEKLWSGVRGEEA